MRIPKYLYLLSIFILLIVVVVLIHQASPRDFITHSKLFSSEDVNALRTKRLQSILKCHDRELETGVLQHGDFWVLRNFIRGLVSRNVGCGETITYTTQADFQYLKHLPTLVERWRAPISYALFTPGSDLNHTLLGLQYLRNCHDSRELIRQYVSIHLYFPYDHMPDVLPRNESDVAEMNEHDCSTLASLFAQLPRQKLYRHEKGLTYPINVGRNIARNAVNTYFIMPTDVELFPSLGLVAQFLDMVLYEPEWITNGTKRVFALPAYEVAADASLPFSKVELVELLNAQRAVPFHHYTCWDCHAVPGQAEWPLLPDVSKLSVFRQSKRVLKFRHWEAVYISDNREPLFDERITWEGKCDKRIQNFAMCLMDYEYDVLHPAFVVHTPGIKRLPKAVKKVAKRKPAANAKPKVNLAVETQKLIWQEISPEYKILYGTNELCKV